MFDLVFSIYDIKFLLNGFYSLQYIFNEINFITDVCTMIHYKYTSHVSNSKVIYRK